MAVPRPTPLRPIKIIGDTAFVTLTRGHIAKIDAADAALVEPWNWSAHVKPTRVYAYRRSGGKLTAKNLMLHRFILGDVPEGMDVDHINGDPLDNRRANLRVATRAQNVRNKGGTPGRALPRGVVRQSKRAYRAQIMFNRKHIHLGSFPTVEAAHEARLAAEILYFGEFAHRQS